MNDCHSNKLQQTKEKDHPNVLVIGPPGNLGVLKPKHPQKYNLSKPWTTSLPLHHFMVENHYDPSKFQALICSPWGPPINAFVLKLVPCLKLVVTTSSGTDHIDLRECHSLGIQVANTGDLYSQDVADMALALLIGVLTKISAADRFVRTQMMFDGPRDFPLCSNSKVRLICCLLFYSFQ